MRVWIEVSERKLAANFRAIAAAAGPGTDVLAVVKADAYGHGAEPCSVTLARAGAAWLGVTCAAEGARIRQALLHAGFPGDTPRILAMCGLLPDEVPLLREHILTPVVWTSEHVRWLQSVSPLRVHLEIDTGMGRQGVAPGPALEALLDDLAGSNLRLEAALTHFSSSEQARLQFTQTQQRRFEQAVAQLDARGLPPAILHAGNSSMLDNPAHSERWLADVAGRIEARPMVRSGLALYGYCLPIEPAAGQPDPLPALRPALEPVLTWKTRILAIRELAPGDTVGYGATFAAPAQMRVALLAAGYADGLRRELSSTTGHLGGWVTIAGRRARILGRISMNLTVVDVSSIPEAAPGGEAVLLGEGITAADHARLARTIPYEILRGLRER